MARLELYGAMLVQWQRRINLVSRASLDDLWRRHMLDSAQLIALIPPSAARVVDLGSGAGFPGLVLAVMGLEGVELVESNRRKCEFLNAVAHATDTAVTVTCARIERAALAPADLVVARALAPLDRLLGHVATCLKPGGTALLLKGAEVERELTAAAKHWTMRLTRHPSRSDPTGVIVEIRDLAPADAA